MFLYFGITGNLNSKNTICAKIKFWLFLTKLRNGS